MLESGRQIFRCFFIYTYIVLFTHVAEKGPVFSIVARLLCVLALHASPAGPVTDELVGRLLGAVLQHSNQSHAMQQSVRQLLSELAKVSCVA